MTSGNFWNLEIGNLESARNWLVLANLNILGIFPTQFRSLSLILNSELQISNFQIPEISRCHQKLPKISVNMLEQSFLQIFSKKTPILEKKLISW